MIHYDEYGQPIMPKHREWSLKINLTRCRDAWRKFWGPREEDIDERLLEAKRRAAEWEAMFSKPTGRDGINNPT